MFKISHNCIHFTCQQGNAQNPSIQALKVHEPRTSRYTNWIQKRQRNRDQIANIHCIIEKAREFQKNIYLCFIDYAKAFDSVDHKKLWKILKEVGITGHLTCLLRNLYVGKDAVHGVTKSRTRLSDFHFHFTYLPPEKSILRSKSNSQNRTQNNGLVQNWERRTSRLYIVTLLI